MADRGHELTDEILNDLENRIAEEYAVATRDMQRKFRDYMEKFEAENAKQKALLEAGKITEKEYSDWRFRHIMMGKRWSEMKDVLAADMEKATEIALKISGEKMADVYALNANFATYQIEHDAKIDTGFTLYNHDTAEYLLADERQLMPGPSTRKAKEIAANKSMQWNRQKIQSAVLQGVLQGESPYSVAERLRRVGEMNYNASVRYARTMTTSAQNAGRYESYRRATRLGVDLTIEWQATLDSRTRHDHRLMHGQRTEVDKPFHTPDGFTIYYPADSTGESNAPQREIWNCRCTLLAWVKGYEGETIRSSPKMGDMTFAQWQNEHSDNTPKLTGKNVTEEYKNRSNGSAKVIVPPEYKIKNHEEEISMANWIANTFGGTIELIPESQEMTPDYIWEGKLWELKSPSTEKAVDAALRKGIKQINSNPGGIILNFKSGNINMTEVEKMAEGRMKRGSFETADILMLKKGELIQAIRYKK